MLSEGTNNAGRVVLGKSQCSADVVIIGGGIIGLSIALRLRREKLSVIVLESVEPGKEASYAAAGLIAPKFEPATEPFARMAIASRDIYPEFCVELRELTGVDPEYRSEGTLMPLLSEEEERWAADLTGSADDSVPLTKLTRGEVLSLEPSIAPEVHSGLLVPGDHQVNNRMLLQALLKAVESLGARIQRYTPVRALRVRSNGELLVESDSTHYTGGTVVLSAGCWSHLIEMEDPSLRPPTRPVKGQMVALQMEPARLLTHNVHSPRCYLVPRLGGRVEVGSTVEEVGFNKRVTSGAVEKLLHAALSVLPALQDCSLIETWAGLRPGSPDQHPIVGLTSVEGLLMATGNYRSGLLMAPITAKLVTELIMTGRTPALLEPFSPSRFGRADAPLHQYEG